MTFVVKKRRETDTIPGTGFLPKTYVAFYLLPVDDTVVYSSNCHLIRVVQAEDIGGIEY